MQARPTPAASATRTDAASSSGGPAFAVEDEPEDERSVLRRIVATLRSSRRRSTEELLALLGDPLRLMLSSSSSPEGAIGNETSVQLHAELLKRIASRSDARPQAQAPLLSEAGPSSSTSNSTSAHATRGNISSWSASVPADTLRVRMLASSFVEDVQYLMLTKLAVDWAEKVDQDVGAGTWEELLRAWFVPDCQVLDQEEAEAIKSIPLISMQAEPPAVTSHASAVRDKGKGKLLERSAAQTEVLHAASSITCATLRTCTKLLSEAGQAASARGTDGTPADLTRPLLPAPTIDALLSILSHLSPESSHSGSSAECKRLSRMHEGIQTEASQTRRMLVFKDLVTQWTALPTRLANALQGKVPERLQNEWVTRIA